VTLLANALENDKLLTVKPLETKFDVSYGTMQTILLRLFKLDSKKLFLFKKSLLDVLNN